MSWSGLDDLSVVARCGVVAGRRGRSSGSRNCRPGTTRAPAAGGAVDRDAAGGRRRCRCRCGAGGSLDVQRERVLARRVRADAPVGIQRKLQLRPRPPPSPTRRRGARRRCGSGSRTGGDPGHRDGEPVLAVAAQHRTLLRPLGAQRQRQLPTPSCAPAVPPARPGGRRRSWAGRRGAADAGQRQHVLALRGRPRHRVRVTWRGAGCGAAGAGTAAGTARAAVAAPGPAPSPGRHRARPAGTGPGRAAAHRRPGGWGGR